MMMSSGLRCSFIAMMVALAVPALAAEWPELTRVSGEGAKAAMASLPLPQDLDESTKAAVASGCVEMDGRIVQLMPVARRGAGAPPRRVLAYLARDLPDKLSARPSAAKTSGNAGWSWEYRLLDNNVGKQVNYIAAMRNVPLEQTEYEMYQLDLRRNNDRIGVRLGLRRDNRLYWWQFIRADFVARGPVCDILRCGGPIYNEETTVQGDLYLVLYANGVVDAYAHFINNQREGIGRDTHGIPVIAFDIPGKPQVEQRLDGTRAVLPMGEWRLNLGQSAGYADAQRPGSLRTEDGVVVLQPWMDQEIYGELLVEREGVPEDHVVNSASRNEENGYWVAKPGDQLIPQGMARTVRFTLAPGSIPPQVARYEAPGWWHALCGALPTEGKLPVRWRALTPAVNVSEEYFRVDTRRGPFELGCMITDSDGTIPVAMLLLARAINDPRYSAQALLPAYWWADLAIDHVDFTVREVPKYSWQWIVQPYMGWAALVYAYWETGDPYLLETARFTADAYYRFFWSNRPHRFVGRDVLPCLGLLALYEGTAEDVYLQRVREILAEARRSWEQTQYYWPGHQSGGGPNGAARQPSFGYIPLVQAALYTHLLQIAPGKLAPEEEAAAWRFLRFTNEVFRDKGRDDGWVDTAVCLAYPSLTALADRYPDESDKWIALLNWWNNFTNMPDKGRWLKAYDWMVGALCLDSWAWGAEWRDGALELRPRYALLDAPRAPQRATISTPRGDIEVQYKDARVEVVGSPGFQVRVHGSAGP